MSSGEAKDLSQVLVFVTVDNSTNRLSQNEWCHMVASMRSYIHRRAWTVEEFFTEPSSNRQSVCWSLRVYTHQGADKELKKDLAMVARSWHVESIEWSEATMQDLTPS